MIKADTFCEGMGQDEIWMDESAMCFVWMGLMKRNGDVGCELVIMLTGSGDPHRG